MTTSDVVATLTREHHEIDSDIGAFIGALGNEAIDATALATAFEALRRHIYLEEEFLFPPIREAGMVMPLLVMANEHGTIWRLMDSIEASLAGPDPDRDLLRAACTELLERLAQHNGKEEPVVYPRAAVDLDDEAAGALAEYLRTARTPDGWVCEAIR